MCASPTGLWCPCCTRLDSVDFVRSSIRRIQERDFKFLVEISHSQQLPRTSGMAMERENNSQVNPSHLFGNDQTSHRRWLQLCSVTATFQTVSFQTKLSTSWMKLLRRLGAEDCWTHACYYHQQISPGEDGSHLKTCRTGTLG